jgi:predicted alpha/beta-hydrolase family hydrolase
MRDAHLKDIQAPMLFVQGARDTFGTAEEIGAAIKRLRLPARVYVIEGGDHSFKVPKSLGVPQPTIYEMIMDKVVEWTRELAVPPA